MADPAVSGAASATLIKRHHRSGATRSLAVYSPCERYRYALTRTWAPAGRRRLYILLNPSTADEIQNDPTVERCARRAQASGFGAFRVCNIFAWRATHPRDLRAAADPVGRENDRILQAGCRWADEILCGWGTHGAHLDRGPKVAARLLRLRDTPVKHLGLTKDGHPRHPLYISYAKEAEPWG